MKRLHWILISILVLYLLGLGWGYISLPTAAIKNLGGYRTIAAAPAVSFSEGMDVSPAQRWYLEHAFTESPVQVVPRLSVKVDWNAILLARVGSGYFVSGKSAENKSSLYLCAFGYWIPVHTFYQDVS